MPKFGKVSQEKLATCHPDLQKVFNEVIKHVDCSVLAGHRTEAEQNACYYAKPPTSKLQWPKSKHNSLPSLAVDVAPWPIDWKDRERFILFGGFVLGIAKSLGVSLTWGGDFNGNWKTSDDGWDLPHFELKG